MQITKHKGNGNQIIVQNYQKQRQQESTIVGQNYICS